MSGRPLIRDLHYFDVVAVLLIGIIVLGRLSGPSSPPPIRDLPGVWLPVLAAALIVAFRRRAYAQATPWLAGTFAALAFAAIAAIFWRWNVMLFIGATLSAAVLLLGGLVLRTRRLSEPLSRTDLFGLIAMGASVVLTLALGEALVRVGQGAFSEEIQQFLRGANPGNFGVAHPYVGHLHTPNNAFVAFGRDFRAVHHVDGLGFRNGWPWPEQAEIVTVGDSVTFGQCVEDDEAWPYLLGRRIAPRHLINLGLIGAGPQQYLRVYETFGVKLRPRLLIVGLFARNDFWDAGVFDRWLQAGVGGNYMVWRDFGRPRRLDLSVRDPLGSVERLLRFRLLPVLRRSYLFALVRGLRGGVEGETPPAPRILHLENGKALHLLPEDFVSKTRGGQPDEPIFQTVLDSLRQIQAVASRAGTHVLLVLLPGKEEVYLPILGESIPDPTAALRSALDDMGIEHLNLTPAFRARATEGAQLFFEVDGHPNRAGQALIAELVHDHIRKNAGRYGLEE